MNISPVPVRRSVFNFQDSGFSNTSIANNSLHPTPLRAFGNTEYKSNQPMFSKDSIFYEEPSSFDYSEENLQQKKSKNSIFFEPIQPTFPPSSATLKPSKNSIFDEPMQILKPAMKMTEEELLELKGGERDFEIKSRRQSYTRPINSPSRSASPAFSSFTTPMVIIPETRMSSITVPLSLPESPSQFNSSNFGNLSSHNRRGWVDLDETREIKGQSATPAWTREFKNPTLDAALETNTDISIRRKISKESKIKKESHVRSAVNSDSIIIQDGYTEPLVFDENSTSKHSLKSDNINLVFFPTGKNYLGEGRYAQVFKAQFTIREPKLENNLLKKNESVFSLEIANTTDMKERDFQTCAVKRTHDTPDAQSQGVSELQILQKVYPLCNNIIALIGAKDENENEIPPGKKVQKRMSIGPVLSVTSGVQQRKKSATRSRLLIILEYASNGNMWEWIKSHPETIGRRLWLRWAKQLAIAVKSIHGAGIVHHDIKPHNCLLSEMLDVKLADFGNAIIVPEDGLTDEEEHEFANEDLLSRGIQISEKSRDSYFASTPTISSVSNTPTSSSANNFIFTHPNTQSVQSQSKRIALTANTHFNMPSQSNTPEPSSPPSPSGLSVRSMQSSSSTRSLLVRDGIGRGTEAYTAPELFATSSNSEYSFPVDMYSVGVTLYTLITGIEPFSRAKSSVHMMLGISKGFFESGLQAGVGTAGPDLDDYKTIAEEARTANSELKPLAEIENSSSQSELLSTSQSSFSSTPHFLLRPPTPSFQAITNVLKHLNGEPVDKETVSLLKRLLAKDPSNRLTASELVDILDEMETEF
ncbi:hypothetical protein HK096_002907 [Nowakowskiella sp. JEL0078]|nr:hypothetical protein HK096_002907 [Nowakowskiella sp. JEL0078]